MKKSTKGAVAAVAAGVLLLGGAGSLAYWSDEADVDGGSVNSGSIELAATDCADAPWTHTEDGSEVGLIVPGDTIEKECEATLVLEGDHIGATVELDADALDDVEGELGQELEASATIPDGPVTGEGTHDVSVTIAVEFPGEPATNASQDGAASLNGLTLTATQTHEAG